MQQTTGDYGGVLAYLKSPEKQNLIYSNDIVNYIKGIELKLFHDQRPSFVASRDIKKGDLVIAEKPLANIIEVEQQSRPDWVYKELAQQCGALQGVNALRLSFLLNGKDSNNEIPQLQIFTENYYKRYDSPQLSTE